jgi:translocator protein
MSSWRSSRIKTIAAAALSATVVAAAGAAMTDLGPWYQSLRQPWWKPPDALFGPAWTLIFGLTAVAGIKAWEQAPNRAVRDWSMVLFALNVLLNVLWSTLFFRLQRPDWALVEVVLLWLSIVALIVYVGRFAPSARWLLLPYLLWVTFAGALNWAVVVLNPR